MMPIVVVDNTRGRSRGRGRGQGRDVFSFPIFFFCSNLWVVAKTRGRGRGSFFPSLFCFLLLFVFCRYSPVLFFSNDRHLFTKESYKKILIIRNLTSVSIHLILERKFHLLSASIARI